MKSTKLETVFQLKYGSDMFAGQMPDRQRMDKINSSNPDTHAQGT